MSTRSILKYTGPETKPNSAIITGVAGDALELQIDFFFISLTLIGLVFNNDFIKLWMYKVIGWGLPSIPILIWSILMHQSNPIHEELRSDDVISSMCWISDVGNWIVWLRRGPILFILAFNLLILLHIIKILICSQIRNGQDSNQLIKVRISS